PLPPPPTSTLFPYTTLFRSCDDDTWWEPGSLRRAADLFDAHPRLALAVARVLVGPEEREDPVCRELEQSPIPAEPGLPGRPVLGDRKSTRLNSSHVKISYAV